MSDVQHVPPAVAIPDLVARPTAADDLAPLTSRVRDAAARVATVAEQAHALTRGHPASDAGDATHAELTTARGHLHDAVGVLAARLRRDGLPPQRMLVVVKDAVRAAAPAGGEALAVRDVMGDAVRWGIAAYFAAA